MNCLNLGSLKILHVDANERVQPTVRTIFHAMQIKQLSFLTDASQILQQIDHLNPDILMTEYFTVPFDGIALIRKVRQHRNSSNPHIPFILLTAQTERPVADAV